MNSAGARLADIFVGRAPVLMEVKVSLPEIRRANTILYCRRWRECVHFYRDVLGLPGHTLADWFVEFRLAEHSYISIADASQSTIEAQASGITLSWQVEGVEALHHRLSKLGVKTGPLHTRWGARAFFFHDPEGHRLEAWSTAPGEIGPNPTQP